MIISKISAIYRMRDFTSSQSMDQTLSNPFLEDIFVDHPSNLPGIGRMHHDVFSKILESVESLHSDGRSSSAIYIGRVFLITSPEAGYGKSHLVARLRDHLGSIATTVALPFDRSRPVTWPVTLTSVLRQFSITSRSRLSPVTHIEEISRYFLSRLVLNCLANGSVKERECPESAHKISSDFTRLFSQGSDSPMLPWIQKRSGDLVRQSTLDFGKNLGMVQAELGFWCRVFVDLNQKEEGALDQLRGLSSGEARERLLQLLRIATDYRPVMLVADGLDGFFSSETAGMEITEIVSGIRERVPRTVTLVTLNEDVWKSVFDGKLPSAWRDRLTGETSRLHSISPEAATDLVRLRLNRIGLKESSAARFAEKLGDENLWIDTATKLTPRVALRQAADLWGRESASFLNMQTGEDLSSIEDEPLSNLTDKAAFFASLQNDRPQTVSSATPPPLPETESVSESPNPFYAASTRQRETELAGIDSIISDIRGSGKTVVSETADIPSSSGSVTSSPAGDHATLHPDPFVQSRTNGTTTNKNGEIPNGFVVPPFSTASVATTPAAQTFSRASLEAFLARREMELLSGPPLVLDLERIERFIRAIGGKHSALSQQEERYPGSRTVCLRWSVRGHYVLTGFESPRNVYFWNNLLQQSLSSNRSEKITAFSHHSDSFDPSIFASFGFSPTVIRGRIDVIEMGDRKVAMIYAAEEAFEQNRNHPDFDKVTQLLAHHLDPLWRRMVQSL